MKPGKILYVDDEQMALKYFERLVSPTIPVLTAVSVAQGKALLDEHAGEIAVLVSDQRMPGGNGNELLNYARNHHPLVVRMLTTAFSELNLAIEAINAGEIYRYITKPWDIESLRIDLKNAMDLAELRNERNCLMREKMLLLQQQLMAIRVGQLAVACPSFTGQDCAQALYTFLDGAARAGCKAPEVNWQVLDHSDLIQAEARRSIAVGRDLAALYTEFGSDKFPQAAGAALAKALPQHVLSESENLHIAQPRALYGVLEGSANEIPPPQAGAWLAWLIWYGQPIVLKEQGSGWDIELRSLSTPAVLRKDWLAACIDQLALQH